MIRDDRSVAAVSILLLAVGLGGPQGAFAEPIPWKVTKTLSDHKGGVNNLAFTPDGKILASASSDKTVGLWDTATGKPITFLKGHKGRVFCVAFSPDGKTVAAGGENQIVTWDTAKFIERVDEYDLPLGSLEPNVLSIAFAPDGDRLMVAAYALDATSLPYKIYSKCMIYEAKSGKVVRGFSDGANNYQSPVQAVPSPDWEDFGALGARCPATRGPGQR